MDDFKVIEIKRGVLDANDDDARALREELRAKGTFLLNVMSSPGAGKTTTLIRVINLLKDEFSISVMEADIDGDSDTRKIIEETGVRAEQLHTGGMCHLDAWMTRQGLESLEGDSDLVILENVGNLVCPAEFDTGASENLMILSVPEGDDKPLKYPLMFQVSDIVVINKTDCLPLFDFSVDLVKERIAKLNPKARVFPVCAKDGAGIRELADAIKSEMVKWRK